MDIGLYECNGTTWQTGAVFSGLAWGNYTILVQDAGGLSNSVTVQLAKVCIIGTLTSVDATCGENNGTITVLASGGATPYTYSINGTNVQRNAVFGALAPGNYTIQIVDANGFSGAASTSIAATSVPSIAAQTTPASCYNNDGIIDVTATGGTPPLDVEDINGSGFESFSWSPATGLDNAAIRDPIASPEESITYTVLASTAAGCQAQGTRSIKVYSVADIFVPNAFTPNGDGHIDVLHARPVGIKDFKYFAIFNRWGQRVFYTADPSVGWDGSTGGHYVNATTFVWIAAGIDYRGVLVERRGTVIVVK